MFLLKLINVSQQTEEDFLSGLTQGFPDDSVEEDREDESEESDEEEDEEPGEESQNDRRQNQSIHSTVERRTDIQSMVITLQQEGETLIFRSLRLLSE